MTEPRVHRNDPCPCGSGRKYKSCHGRRGSALTRPIQLPIWALVSIVVVLGGGILYLFQVARTSSGTGIATLPRAGTSLPAAETAPVGEIEPSPYQYDPRTHRYWDPNHRHWHDGLPPGDASGAARDTGRRVTVSPLTPLTINPSAEAIPNPEPAPYFYNEETGKYWDPVHRHWHNGRPNVDSLKAAEAQRSQRQAAQDSAPATAPASAVTPLSAPAPTDTTPR